MLRVVFLISVWLGAVVLVPSGAHLLEMSHKLLMDRTAYFSAQQLYLGWALFGVPIVLKVILDGVLAVRLRHSHRAAACGTLLSAALIAAGLVVFFVWVQPANVATQNWGAQPSNWESLRLRWEYGHMAIAILTLIAFGAVSYSATKISWQD
jgi:hypothetical protein